MRKQAKKAQNRPKNVDELTLDHQNARQRGQNASETLSKSLEQFGAARSVVIDAEGIVRAGNGTVEAAKAAGITKIKVIKGNPDELVVVQRSDLKGERAQAYAIADNRTGELAEWDLTVLGRTLESLTEYEPSDLGFEDSDLRDLFPEDDVTPPEAFSEVDENIPTEHECPNCGYRFSGKASTSRM